VQPAKTNPPILFPAYPVSRAFGPNAMPMTSKQRAWIRRIVNSRTYGNERAILYFAYERGSGTPIVVYEQYRHGATGSVIGAGCLYFSPYEGLFTGPDCLGTAKPPIP
jgi:hypothetical protein